jgi:2-iminoacetate synthase
MRLSSGPPWHLDYDVERIGNDYLCRIHGGERHIGAVALSEWRRNRATTECIAASGHKERGIAAHAAHRLCVATKRRVSCIAGIHFDALSYAEIETIVQTVHALTRQAASQLEDERLAEARDAPACLLSRIEPMRAELSREIDAFLALSRNEAIDAARAVAAAALADNFGNQVAVFAPLYLASACSNDCADCGFRRSARVDRTRLSIEQAVQEAGHLASSGHRTIDLVTGEIATDRFVDYVCEATRAILAATDIRRINLNLGALSTQQYRRLRSAGAAGYHLYQETYAPRTYLEVHQRGLKRDMAYRLDAPHRAADAGFESIGLGILLGLHAVREDLASLVAHARILIEDFPRLRIGFSLPRLQHVDAGCEYTAAAAVGDDEFVKALLFLRLQFPRAHLTVTTRERPEVRDELVSLGVTKLSAGVSTAPGGYTLDRPGTEQFDISDRRSLPDIVQLIQRAGMTATYE